MKKIVLNSIIIKITIKELRIILLSKYRRRLKIKFNDYIVNLFEWEVLVRKHSNISCIEGCEFIGFVCIWSHIYWIIYGQI